MEINRTPTRIARTVEWLTSGQFPMMPQKDVEKYIKKGMSVVYLRQTEAPGGMGNDGYDIWLQSHPFADDSEFTKAMKRKRNWHMGDKTVVEVMIAEPKPIEQPKIDPRPHIPNTFSNYTLKKWFEAQTAIKEWAAFGLKYRTSAKFKAKMGDVVRKAWHMLTEGEKLFWDKEDGRVRNA